MLQSILANGDKLAAIAGPVKTVFDYL